MCQGSFTVRTSGDAVLPDLTASKEIDMNINQIVKGKVAGTFIILGFRKIGGEDYAQLKEVNPNDYTQTMRGEIALPITALDEI